MDRTEKGGKTEMDQTSISSWDGFLGSNFLKAEDVKEDQFYICKSVELDTENDRPMLVLELAGMTYKFGLNVTNSVFVKEAGIKTPKELIGKKIKFRIGKAFSPLAKKEVDSLRVCSVE